MHLLWIVLTFFSISPCKAQSNSVAALQDLVSALKNDKDLTGANFSLSIKDATSGADLFNYNEDALLIPASSLKLLTSQLALEKLGPDFRFLTQFGVKGDIVDDRVEGNLVLVGSGDPTFGSERIEGNPGIDELCALFYGALLEKGVNAVSGDLIVNSGAFDRNLTPGKWLWEDMGNYYGAGASGFNVNENILRVTLGSGAPGTKSDVLSTAPKLDYVQISSDVKAGPAGSGDNAYAYSDPYSNYIHISGTVPPSRGEFTIKAAMPDPALYFGNYLKDYLVNRGILIEGIVKHEWEFGSGLSSEIYNHYSPNLDEILYWTNQKSINLYAEAILKVVAGNCNVKANTANGVNEVYKFIDANSLDGKYVKVHDGSGLSPMNRVNTSFFSDLLCHVYNSAFASNMKRYYSVAGGSGDIGYMRNLLKGTAAQGKVRGKSGYLFQARSYAGEYTSINGEDRVFCFIVNNYSCSAGEMRKKMEKIMAAMVGI